MARIEKQIAEISDVELRREIEEVKALASLRMADTRDFDSSILPTR